VHGFVQLAVYYDELEMSARQDEPNQSLLLSAREIEVEPSSLEADSSGSNRRTRRARLADTLVGPFAPPKEIKMVLLAGVKGICGAGAVKCSRPPEKQVDWTVGWNLVGRCGEELGVISDKRPPALHPLLDLINY
jgi:hypothetical protein